MYKCHNLTPMIITMTSKAQIRAFLKDRERSVRSKMWKGLAADVPSAELLPLFEELTLILSLREEIAKTLN